LYPVVLAGMEQTLALPNSQGIFDLIAKSFLPMAMHFQLKGK
jgi:hypothetical protein